MGRFQVSSPATTIPSGPTLVACTDSPYEPFESIVDGEPVGFDMDLLRLVGTALDRPTDVVVEPLDQFPARLADGGIYCPPIDRLTMAGGLQ